MKERLEFQILHERCFRIYLACTVDQLQRQGEIPLLGGIRVVRERIPDAPTL
jgi:hypothetical protein